MTLSLSFVRSILLAAAAAVSVAALAQPASAPADRPAMKPISPKTSSRGPLPMPPRADDVWVNTSSRVYHCPGSSWWGRTPKGIWLTEADARAEGFKPAAAKGCAA